MKQAAAALQPPLLYEYVPHIAYKILNSRNARYRPQSIDDEVGEPWIRMERGLSRRFAYCDGGVRHVGLSYLSVGIAASCQ